MKKIVTGILAHVDSGKTTLSEAMLYRSGNINKLGRVDHKNSFLDTFSLERERGITIFSKQAVLNYGDTVFTLLDTPGHVDFSAETERTLQVLDYAILVISGTDGVQSHTLTLWKLLSKYNVPCFIFVNKTDIPTVDKDGIMYQLKQKLSESCADFTDRNDGKFYEGLAECDDRLLDEYYSSDTIEKEVSQIRIYSGEKFTSEEYADAGTVCAVTGISFALPGDGLGAEKNSSLPILTPVLTYSLELPPEINSHTALEKLKILENEDPQLNIVWNERYAKIQLRLMGEIQLEVLKAVISQRFGFEVKFGTGSIIYKETITNEVEGVGHFEPLRHYAEVHLLLRPGKRNSGIVFRSECREDSLDKNWQRLILSNLYEKAHVGVLGGFPITDMEIILLSGKAHPKHTEGGDFRQAALRAVRQGLRCADSILLEPVYSFTLEVPSECIGRAISDIQKMSGSFDQPETAGEMSVINGKAPVSEISNYGKEVTQYTHGTGRLVCSFSGYEECHNTEEILSAADYDPERDIDNPSDSVFCSHGAGFNVKWNDVPKYMHIPYSFGKPKNDDAPQSRRIFSECRNSRDIFALDKELMHIFEQTYGPVKRRQITESKVFTAPVNNDKQKNSAAKYDDDTEYLLVDGYNVIFS